MNEADFEKLLSKTKQNNPDFTQQELNQLQTNAAIKRAKYNLFPNFNIIASYGNNQSSPTFNDAYKNLLNQKNITLGVAMPIYTSGANYASYSIAKYQLSNQRLQQQIFENQIRNDLLNQIIQYKLGIEGIDNTLLSDSLAQKRYSILVNKYKAGKLTYTDLLNAQYQRDQSHISYINAVFAYWSAYYQLRATTLYDWEKQESLFKGN